MDSEDSRSAAPRGRPRDPAREERVLKAAVEEYAERGWAGLTMDGVAKRAGVGKSTIYLRWTNKEDLLAAAVQRLALEVEPPDTGSVRGDFTVLVRRIVLMYYTTLGWGMFRILVDVAGSGTGIGELQELNERQRAQAYAILDRGIERGELRAGAPQQVVINGLYGTIAIYRMMDPWDRIQGLAPDPDMLVQQVVEFVMAGLGEWITERADA